MTMFWITALSGCAGLGLWLAVQGLRGRQVFTSPALVTPDRASVRAALVLAVAAVMAALVVATLTRWPVAAAATAIGVLLVPRFKRRHQERQRHIERTQAIATWTEMVRDNMAGAAGLGQALIASSALAPAAIRPEVARFAARLDQATLHEALAELGDDLDHPTADLIVAAMSTAARTEARELGPLLARLADSARADVRMRLRVEVSRARVRASARIVVGVTAGLIVLLFLAARDLLAVYDTVGGQLWLVVVLAVFAAGGWVMSYYGRLDLGPQRLGPQRTRTEGGPADE